MIMLWCEEPSIKILINVNNSAGTDVFWQASSKLPSNLFIFELKNIHSGIISLYMERKKEDTADKGSLNKSSAPYLK